METFGHRGGWTAVAMLRDEQPRGFTGLYFNFVPSQALDDEPVIESLRRMTIANLVDVVPAVPTEEVRSRLFTHQEMADYVAAHGETGHPTGLTGDPAVMIAYHPTQET